MGAIRENATKQRTVLAFYASIPTEDVPVWGPAIDTAGYESGIYVSSYMASWLDGAATLLIRHADASTDDFIDVEPASIIYGDGNLPSLAGGNAPGTFVPRFGLVGQKRWIKVGMVAKSPDTMVAVALVTMSTELSPLPPDAYYFPLDCPVGGLTSSGTVAEFDYGGALPDEYQTGVTVLITDASPSEYNGEYIIRVTGTNTFAYDFAGSGTSPATGNIYARRAIKEYESLTGGG